MLKAAKQTANLPSGRENQTTRKVAPFLLLLPLALVMAFACKKEMVQKAAGSGTLDPTPLQFEIVNPADPSDKHVVLEYYEGDAGSPFVFIAPHSGMVKPAFIPDRTEGFQPTEPDNPYNNDKSFVNSRDFGSDLVALETAQRIAKETGVAPHVVIVKLSRTKADLNRRKDVATQNNPISASVWEQFHAYIETAKTKVKAAHNNRGMLFDFHTQAHKPDRIEVGYLFSDEQLKDTGLTAYASVSSIRGLVNSTQSMTSLVKGPNSFGQLLVDNGFVATPSRTFGSPVDHFTKYFNGGYNTARHGSKAGGSFSAIQLECSPVSVNVPTYKNGQRPQFVEVLSKIIPSYVNSNVLK